MYVDEARRNALAVSVDFLTPRFLDVGSDGGNAPSFTATSPLKAGAPVPSTTSPLRITKSYMSDLSFYSSRGAARRGTGRRTVPNQAAGAPDR